MLTYQRLALTFISGKRRFKSSSTAELNLVLMNKKKKWDALLPRPAVLHVRCASDWNAWLITDFCSSRWHVEEVMRSSESGVLQQRHPERNQPGRASPFFTLSRLIGFQMWRFGHIYMWNRYDVNIWRDIDQRNEPRVSDPVTKSSQTPFKRLHHYRFPSILSAPVWSAAVNHTKHFTHQLPGTGCSVSTREVFLCGYSQAELRLFSERKRASALLVQFSNKSNSSQLWSFPCNVPAHNVSQVFNFHRNPRFYRRSNFLTQSQSPSDSSSAEFRTAAWNIKHCWKRFRSPFCLFHQLLFFPLRDRYLPQKETCRKWSYRQFV